MTQGRILVVDDEEVVHASIRRILMRFGFEVAGVLKARDGLDRLRQESFDAVITDLMMPEMNGVEMLAALKEADIHVPTIMITGYPTIKTAVEALRLGAVDYIPKPFTRQELLNPLNRALRRSEHSDPLGETCQEPSIDIGPEPGDCFLLSGHSWALYRQDGLVEIGVDRTFLDAIPPIREVILPVENTPVEQGVASIQINCEQEEHYVFMPLSGQVTAVNRDMADHALELTAHQWLLRVLPSRLSEELPLLKKVRRR